MKGTKKWGRGVWLRVLTFVLLSIVKHQTAKIINNITYHTSQRPPFPSKVNETWAGSQPFQYGLGDCHPTQNANPQTLPSLGCLRIVYIVQKECAVGLNPHLHAFVAELHYHDGAALQAGADGCCAVGSS